MFCEGPTQVNISLEIYSIASVDEKQSDFTINLLMEMKWFDSRLDFSEFNLTDCASNQNQRVLEGGLWHLERVWIPYLRIPHSKEPGQFENSRLIYFRVESNGYVRIRKRSIVHKLIAIYKLLLIIISLLSLPLAIICCFSCCPWDCCTSTHCCLIVHQQPFVVDTLRYKLTSFQVQSSVVLQDELSTLSIRQTKMFISIQFKWSFKRTTDISVGRSWNANLWFIPYD